MAAPISGSKITTPFGKKGSWAAGYHTGEDWRAAAKTPVLAAGAGTVVYAGNGGGWGSAYGSHIIVQGKGTDGRVYRTLYAHLTRDSWKALGIKAGSQVKLGQKIALSGYTGRVIPAGPGGAHLHFEVRYATKSTRDGQYGYWDHVDPAPIRNLKASGATAYDRMDPAGYYIGAVGEHVLWLGERLVAHGFGANYKVGPSREFGTADQLNVRDFQLAQGWTGSAADGLPGPLTLKLLAADVPTAPVPDVVEFELLPRTDWTATKNARVGDPLTVSKVVAFTCHYPADGDVTYLNLTKVEVAKKLRAYRDSHLKRGWKDIGYNYAIDQAGRVWFLTGDVIGAHSGEAGNPTSIGVLFVVGNNEAPSFAAIQAFRQLRASKLPRFTKATKVQGHQQVPGNSTSCPGDPLMKLIRSGSLVADNSNPQTPSQPVEPAPTPSHPYAEFVLNAANIYSSDYAKWTAKRKADTKAVWVGPTGGRGSVNLASEVNNNADHAMMCDVLGITDPAAMVRSNGNNHAYLDPEKWVITGRATRLLGSKTKQRREVTFLTARHRSTGIIVSFWVSHFSSATGGASDTLADRSRKHEAAELLRLVKTKILPDWDWRKSIGYADMNSQSWSSGNVRDILRDGGLKAMQLVDGVINPKQNSHHTLGKAPAMESKWIDEVWAGPDVEWVDAKQIASHYGSSDHLNRAATFRVAA